MVEEQLLGRGIADSRLLQAMRDIPRRAFVDEIFKNDAYRDTALPIAEGQTISNPYTVALMTASLQLKGKERLLEIGTGSGYHTAVLAQLCQKVYSVERIPTLSIKSRRILEDVGVMNAVCRVGDGTLGWEEEAPFEGIVVTAGFSEVPASLLRQLRYPGGRLVMPVGEKEQQQLLLVCRNSKLKFETQNIGLCRFVKLVGKYAYDPISP